MWADQDRSVPIEPFGFLIRSGLWLNINDLASLAVPTYQVTLLPFRVNDIRVGRVCRRLVAVGEDGHVPVAIADAGLVVRAARSLLSGS